MIKTLFASLGILTLILITVGLVADIRSIDQTSGGYEYPYEGWTGETIDFSSMYQTQEGLFKSGYIMDQFFNCNTGLITWKLLGILEGEFRVFSERAIVVHKPQDECKKRGFNPTSWTNSDLL